MRIRSFALHPIEKLLHNTLISLTHVCAATPFSSPHFWMARIASKLSLLFGGGVGELSTQVELHSG